jgi:hypothetical protein
MKEMDKLKTIIDSPNSTSPRTFKVFHVQNSCLWSDGMKAFLQGFGGYIGKCQSDQKKH